jgi:Zn ribbon nucleic-acid-binding protein
VNPREGSDDGIIVAEDATCPVCGANAKVIDYGEQSELWLVCAKCGHAGLAG